MSIIACDISEFQPVVTDSYPRRWLTFRVCDGDYRDRNAAANLAWCVKAFAAGKLDGFAVYVVYRPGQQSAILAALDAVNVPRDVPVMVDVESWGSQITGDHSTEINALCTALANRQGDQSRVWGYANRNDYATVWPHRPSWLGLVVASYGGTQPASPGPGPLIGWQYTDGQYAVAGLPSSSAPFGACDHNELFLEDYIMPTADEIAQAVWNHPLMLQQAAPLKPVTAPAAAFQVNASDYAHDAKYATAALISQVAGLKAAIAAVTANQNATADEITAAAQKGAQQALDAYQLTITPKTAAQ